MVPFMAQVLLTTAHWCPVPPGQVLSRAVSNTREREVASLDVVVVKMHKRQRISQSCPSRRARRYTTRNSTKTTSAGTNHGCSRHVHTIHPRCLQWRGQWPVNPKQARGHKLVAPAAATLGMAKQPQRWRAQKPGLCGGGYPTPVEASPIPSDDPQPVHPTARSSLSSVTPPQLKQ